MAERAGPATGAPLVEFLADMRRLRAECGWKREQTHRTLARHLLEETHELLEVLDAWEEAPDPGHLCEELGDLLLQVYFHAAIAEESGSFTLDDVARGIIEKMRRRNPHVFGTAAQRAAGGDAAAVNEAWQAIKAEEKPRTSAGSAASGLPPGLPALLHAAKVLDRLDRLDRAGADTVPHPAPTDPASSDPAPADPAAPDPARDLGDRLLALVDEARRAGVDPEQALRDAVRRAVHP